MDKSKFDKFDRRIYLIDINYSGDPSDPKNPYKNMTLEDYASEVTYRAMSDIRTEYPNNPKKWMLNVLRDTRKESVQLAYRMQALSRNISIKTIDGTPESVDDWYNTIGRATEYLLVLSDSGLLNVLGNQICSWKQMNLQRPALFDEKNNFMIDIYKKTGESFPKFSFGKQAERYRTLYTSKIHP